ncbi:MAG: hypothetical protein GWP91_05910 [Rhodobacterales bacterium]|nr:hypothetical protein [Rhodobacterales bacterium]
MIKNILMISSLAALTTLAACSDDGKDSGDTSTTTVTTSGTTTTMTGTTVPMLAIDLVEYPSCAGDTWTYYAETIAWTDGNNIVNAWETGVDGGYNDEHTMPSVDFDAAGGWDVIQRDLMGGVAFADAAEDVNTVFACGVHDIDPTMTFAIRVYDLDGNMGDCAVFSSDTNNGGIDDVYGGMAPEINPVTAAAEISAANCSEWNVAR